MFLGCGDGRRAGGNSSETGNPELVGRILLETGQPAVAAMVSCVPVKFDAAVNNMDSLPVTHTDSLGNFHLDSILEGKCNLEAVQDSLGLRVRYPGIELHGDSKVLVAAVLQKGGNLRLGLQGVADGDSVIVSIPGSTYWRTTVVRFASVFLDSLAPGNYDSIVIRSVHGIELTSITSKFQIISGGLTELDAEPIRFELMVDLGLNSVEISRQDTLLGFPLLVRLGFDRVDFRFIKESTPLRIFRASSNGELPYHVTRWGTSEVELWVQVDSLLPVADDYLRLVWDEQDSGTIISQPTFAARHGFLAWWHFDEGSNQVRDAAEFGFDGRPVAVSAWAGVVGQGLWFDGRTSYVTIPGTAMGPLDFGDADNYSIAVWANLHAPNTSRFLWSKGNYQYHLKYQHPNRWLFDYMDEVGSPWRMQVVVDADSAENFNQWVHLVVVKELNEFRIYRNGVLLSANRSNNNTDEVRFSGNDFEIGRRILLDGTMGQVFWGVMDELSVSGVARSSEWILLSYLNQRVQNYWP